MKKVENSFGSEITFPESISRKFNSDKISNLNGINRCSITKEDLEAVLIRLENHYEDLMTIKKEEHKKIINPKGQKQIASIGGYKNEGIIYTQGSGA